MISPKLPAGAARPASTLRRPLARRRAVLGQVGHDVTDELDLSAWGHDHAPKGDVDAELHAAAEGLHLEPKRGPDGQTPVHKAPGLRILIAPPADVMDFGSEPELSSSHSSNSSAASSPPVTPSPDSTESSEWGLPHFAKVAGWALDVPLPGLAPQIALAPVVLPSGARITPAPGGGHALMLADPRTSHDAQALGQVMTYGFSSNATLLRRDDQGLLKRTRNRGQATKLINGTYAFVIDQSGDLLLSLTANVSGTGPAGAHRSLAAGLPVRFAGELTIQGGEIEHFTPASGNYMTPPTLLGQARAHPLLAAVPLRLPKVLDGVADAFLAADAAVRVGQDD